MPMIRHNDEPGSQAWLQRRLGSFNASDAPAMLGCSTNKTRTQLLNQIYTSIQPEFSDYVQERVLDRGHRIEHFMRAIAAEIMDEDDLDVIGGSLTVSGLSRPLGASLDGRAILGKLIWECKSINDELRANLPHEGRDSAERNDGRKLHKMYRVQCEQQLMVDESAERTLFTAAAVDRDGSITEERHCWYESDPALRAEILAGWKQFDADLAAYVPAPAAAPAPVARPVASLPVVFNMRVEGKLVDCNIDVYKPAALGYIAEINTDLQTDQDFADAEADAKFCRESASKLKLAIEQALGQMGDINVAIGTVKEIAGAFDAKGLALEKLVKSEKESRRENIVLKAGAALRKHVEELNRRLGDSYMPAVAADFGGSVKGKRNLDSMQDAVNTELARAKIAANEIADRIDANIKLLMEQAKFNGLFPDFRALVTSKQTEDLKSIIAARLAKHEQEQRETLERIRREEQERADREAQEKLAQQQREAEARRQDEERQAQAAAAEAERARGEELLRNAPAINADIAQAVEQGELPETLAQDLTAIHDDLTSAAVSNQVISTAQRTAAAVDPEGEPTLRIGAIAEKLGWNMTAEQLRALGIDPAKKERGSVLYHDSQFPHICDALARQAMKAKAEHAQPVAA